MRNLIAFPLLLLAVIFQSSIVSQVKLLSGYADLPMLMLGAWALQKQVKSAWHWTALGGALLAYVSSLPWFVALVGYVVLVYLAQVLRRRVWQAPLLAMFSVAFFGTLIIHFLSFSILSIMGTPFEFGDVMGLITLPRSTNEFWFYAPPRPL